VESKEELNQSTNINSWKMGLLESEKTKGESDGFESRETGARDKGVSRRIG